MYMVGMLRETTVSRSTHSLSMNMDAPVPRDAPVIQKLNGSHVPHSRAHNYRLRVNGNGDAAAAASVRELWDSMDDRERAVLVSDLLHGRDRDRDGEGG